MRLKCYGAAIRLVLPVQEISIADSTLHLIPLQGTKDSA